MACHEMMIGDIMMQATVQLLPQLLAARVPPPLLLHQAAGEWSHINCHALQLQGETFAKVSQT